MSKVLLVLLLVLGGCAGTPKMTKEAAFSSAETLGVCAEYFQVLNDKLIKEKKHTQDEVDDIKISLYFLASSYLRDYANMTLDQGTSYMLKKRHTFSQSAQRIYGSSSEKTTLHNCVAWLPIAEDHERDFRLMHYEVFGTWPE